MLLYQIVQLGLTNVPDETASPTFRAFFHPEEGGSKFFQNTVQHLSDCKLL
jgi:hypothetical protein